jgi:hypothetical protein
MGAFPEALGRNTAKGIVMEHARLLTAKIRNMTVSTAIVVSVLIALPFLLLV